MTRDELIAVGVRALEDVWMDSGDGPSNRELSAAVVDAVEPLIRADERERVSIELERPAAITAHREVRADLRAKVEALSGVHDVWLYRDDVLALFDGDTP